MADNVPITAGSGTNIAADEVVDGTLGTVKVQYVKLMDGTLDATTKISPATSTKQSDGSQKTQLVDGSGNIASLTANAQDVNIKSGSIPAGSAIIGKVTTDQTTHGTTDLVAADITKVNGTAVSGTNGLPITLTDNTNTANVLKSDGTVAGQNSLLVAPAVQTLTFTTSSAGAQTLLANTDVSHYSWIEVVYTSVGVGLGLTGNFSTVSGGTYVSSPSFAAAGALAGNLGVVVGTPYVSPVRGNFFQLAVSALTSGTFAGTVTLRTTPGSYDTMKAVQSGTWSVGSNSATGSAVPANAFYMGALNGANLSGLAMLTANNGDASTGAAELSVGGMHMYNGTTYDRPRLNYNTTTGDTGAKVASFAGATQTNYNQQSAYIYVLCGTVSGTTPTMTAQLQWSPDAGTTWVNLGPATSTITTTGNSLLIAVGPENFSQTAGATPANLTTGATAQVMINAPLPRTWRLNYTITGTTPSFAITAAYVNYQGV